MFITSLFTITKICDQPKCPFVGNGYFLKNDLTESGSRIMVTRDCGGD
jgi:hypothetical protein